MGFQNAFGIFLEYYTSNYLRHNTEFQISWFGSFCTFVIFAFALIAGPLGDRVGPTIPIAIGVVLQLVAIFMTSLCKQYWQFFLAQGLLLGMGMSFVAIPGSGIVPRYFERNRGLALGVAVSGSSIGGVFWPIVFNQMLHHSSIGFPWAMRIAGFVMIPLLAFCLLTIREPIQKGNKSTDKDGKPAVKPKPDLSSLGKAPFILNVVVSEHTLPRIRVRGFD